MIQRRLGAMADLSVSVHIVNWNGGSYLDACLNSVCLQDYSGPMEILVVDNGSQDGSLENAQKKYPGIRVIRNATNLGFCKAHNIAIRESSGDFVMLLNFDILLETDFLSKLVDAMKEPDTGMVSGKLYRSFDEKKTRILDSTGMTMSRYFSTPRGENEEDAGKYDVPECRSIFGPCGAAPLYRRTMLEDIQFRGEYFDEDFFNYVEDVDLAWRAQLRGWKGVYVPQAVAYHERGVTRKSNSQEQYNYYLRGFRNRYLAMFKNITDMEWKRTGRQMRMGELLFLLSPSEKMNRAGVRWKALFEAWRLMRSFQAKREFVQSRLRVSPESMMTFFEYENLSSFHIFWGAVKSSIHQFLCRFRFGQILIRRYRMLKQRLLVS